MTCLRPESALALALLDWVGGCLGFARTAWRAVFGRLTECGAVATRTANATAERMARMMRTVKAYGRFMVEILAPARTSVKIGGCHGSDDTCIL